jgi:hypothetical protein
MIVSRTDARDRILVPLKTVVTAQSLYAIYDDTKKAVPTDGSVKWVRISVRHRRGARASLGRNDGKTKNTQGGFVFVEIYTPRENGLVDSDLISAAFAESFRSGADGDIWISDVSEVEVGEDGNWFRVDVIADFEYDLIQ